MLDTSSIENKINENDGFITTEEVIKLGFTKPTFYSLLDKINLEQYSHGIYVKKDTIVDDLFLFQKRFSKAIFSHETALYLNGYSVREPKRWTATVPSGYNRRNINQTDVNIKSVNSNLYPVGIDSANTIYGNKVFAYNIERAICDILKDKNNVDFQNFQYAITSYMRSSNKDLNKLMKYAKLFKVEKRIWPYLEVLLP